MPSSENRQRVPTLGDLFGSLNAVPCCNYILRREHLVRILIIHCYKSLAKYKVINQYVVHDVVTLTRPFHHLLFFLHSIFCYNQTKMFLLSLSKQ